MHTCPRDRDTGLMIVGHLGSVVRFSRIKDTKGTHPRDVCTRLPAAQIRSEARRRASHARELQSRFLGWAP
jgi:hypothetical protein